MKKFSILALVVVFTMLLSVVSFAADPAFKLDTREGVTVPETTVVKPGTDNLVVTTPATKDAYYGVLLINGDTLPTVDDNILYIDQKTATGDSVEFTVLPILPENDIAKDLTLYISSNASGEGLITVPVAYGVDAPAYTLGNVYDTDSVINISDVTMALNAYLENVTLTESQSLAADVYPKGKPDDKINISDVTLILNVYLENDTLN